ncbi:MAG: hypothetical protein IJ883_05895, partial [Eubacterium sp.]|nr:hypothetical protein [Eubacterium sp.]
DETGEIIGTMGEEAMSVLCSDADITRIGKAIEILVRAEEAKSIPHIINLMIKIQISWINLRIINLLRHPFLLLRDWVGKQYLGYW